MKAAFRTWKLKSDFTILVTKIQNDLFSDCLRNVHESELNIYPLISNFWKRRYEKAYHSKCDDVFRLVSLNTSESGDHKEFLACTEKKEIWRSKCSLILVEKIAWNICAKQSNLTYSIDSQNLVSREWYFATLPFTSLDLWTIDKYSFCYDL